MNGFSELSKCVSILDRLTKMYYNHGLLNDGIGWGQQFYLEYIYEHNGATAQEMAEVIRVDKATLTKVIKKLSALKYVNVVGDENDKRVKHLYLTDAAIPVAERIKQIHESFYETLSKGVPEEKINETVDTLNSIIENINAKIWHRMEACDGE